MVWAKNKTETLTVAGSPITVTDLTAKAFNLLLTHLLDDGSGIQPRISLQDAGSGTNHASRQAKDGAADSTTTSASRWVTNANENAVDQFEISFFTNIDGEEKLGVFFNCDENATGSGTAPGRREGAGKYSDGGSEIPITQIDIVPNMNDYAIDTNLTILSSD